VQQGGVDYTIPALAGYPFTAKAVNGGMNNSLQGSQVCRSAENPLSQKPPVCRSAGPQDFITKQTDYRLCFCIDYFMAEFIHIQHRKAPLFQ
jgi:hypothetical protein